MNRDSGSGDPSQRTVAELLAEHGGGSQRSARRRRRRAEDPTETAPQSIINRVNSDSGRMRPVVTDDEPPEDSPPPEEPEEVVQAPPSPSAAVPDSPNNPPPPNEQRSAEPSKPPGGSNFWARRFAGTANGSSQGAPPAPAERPQQVNGSGPHGGPNADPEATAQQPALLHPSETTPRSSAPQAETEGPATRAVPVQNFTRRTQDGESPGPPASNPAPPQPPVESATEQFPPVRESGNQEVNGGATGPAENGTALLDYPPDTDDDAYSQDAVYEDPYDSIYYESDYGDDFDEDYGVDDYAGDDDDDFDDDDSQLPAGMGTDDYTIDEPDDEVADSARSPAKEWLALTTQGGAGLLTGGLVWVGFQWLWTALPVAALVAALVVTGSLVLLARKILRTDDLQTILLSVLVGLVCTVSPAALLLVGY